MSNLHNIEVSQDVFRYITDGITHPTITNRRHELKTVNPYYTQVANNQKQFELRFNDRGFAIGDRLVLREYDLVRKSYGSRQMRQVYNVRNDSMLLENYVIIDMGLTFKTLVLPLDRVYDIGDRLQITCAEELYGMETKHVFFKMDYASDIGMKPNTVVLSVA